MGNELSTEERLTRLETQVEHVIALLARLEAKIDARDNVRMDVLEEKLKLRDEKISGLQDALIQLRNEKQTNKTILPAWLTLVPSIAAVVVAIIAIYK